MRQTTIILFCRDREKILYSEEVGHILRTKPSNENEGGIAAGIGAIDSPYLIS